MFTLNNQIDLEELSDKRDFKFERIFMTGETEVTEVIECKLLGVRKPPQVPSKPLYDGKLNDVQWIEIIGGIFA